MPKIPKQAILVTRARQDKQAIFDVFCHHLFRGKTVMSSLEAALSLVENSELIKNLAAIVSPDERSMLWIRSGKGRPSMRKSKHLADGPSEPQNKVVPRFSVLMEPKHYGSPENKPAPRSELSNAVLQVVREAGVAGVTNQEVAAHLKISPLKASDSLRILHLKGYLDRSRIVKRTGREPLFRFFLQGAISEAPVSPETHVGVGG